MPLKLLSPGTVGYTVVDDWSTQASAAGGALCCQRLPCAGSPPGTQMRDHLEEEPLGEGRARTTSHLGQAAQEGVSKGS